MSDACRHIAPGQPAPHIAHDMRVCADCYVFARRAQLDINDLIRLHGMRGTPA